MPKVDPAHEEAVQEIARIFGLDEGGKSTWKSLSAEAAGRKFDELDDLAQSLIHTDSDGEACGCESTVFGMFAAQYLHQFIKLYIASGKDFPTSRPFNFVLLNLIARPYFGSFLRNRADPQPLLRHQISIILSHGLRINPSSRDSPFEDHELLAGFKKRQIIGAHPNQSLVDSYAETVTRAERRGEDAIGKMKELVPLLRREEGVDARTLFKFVEVDDAVHYFPEDTCAELHVESESNSCSDELRACSKCLSVVYCSEEHQKAHWKRHKHHCYVVRWEKGGKAGSLDDV